MYANPRQKLQFKDILQAYFWKRFKSYLRERLTPLNILVSLDIRMVSIKQIVLIAIFFVVPL